MNSASMIRWLLLFVLIGPITLIQAQVPDGSRNNSARWAEVLSDPTLKEEQQLDTLEALKKSGQVRRWIAPHEMARIGLHSPSGQTMSLADAVHTIRQPNLDLYQTANRISHVLSARPEWVESIAETDDAFVITSGVRMMVKDPQALAAASAEFRNNLNERKEAEDKWEDLPKEAQEKLEKFFAEKIAAMPVDHPLASAAKNGPAALFAAAQAGYGEFAITETVVFTKIPLPMHNGRIIHPTFEMGNINFRPNATASLVPDQSNAGTPLPINPEVFQWIAENDTPPSTSNRPAERQEFTHTSGEKQFRHDFLVGFSIGSGWSWERKWESWAGYFQIKLGAGYEFGIRFPMSIRGEARPTMIRRYAAEDAEARFSTQLTLHTFDAGPAYYRQQRVSERHLFDGQEFVLGSRAYFRVKLRAFGSTVINHGKEIGFDYGQNLVPPTPGHDVQFHMAIPPQLTRTNFDFWALSGSAQFGLKVNMAGTASIKSQLVIDREAAAQRSTKIRFNQVGRANLGLSLPPIELSPRQDKDHYRYGLRISEPQFEVSASLTPSVRGQLRSHVPGFRKTFSTGWLDLNRFKLELGSATLVAHVGTRHYRDITIGTKEFERFKSRPIVPGITPPPTGSGSPIASLDLPPAVDPSETLAPQDPRRNVLPGNLPFRIRKGD